MMDLADDAALATFKSSGKNPFCIVMYTASWCQPCRSIKPDFELLAETLLSKGVDCATAYEDKIDVASQNVTAFPTFVIYIRSPSSIHASVRGGKLKELQDHVATLPQPTEAFSDHNAQSLGGGGGVEVSAEDARRARLERLEKTQKKGTGVGDHIVMADNSVAQMAFDDNDDMMVDSKPSSSSSSSSSSSKPTLKVKGPPNAEALSQLQEVMGFPLNISTRSLLVTNNTVEAAVEWIMNHQDDVGANDEVPESSYLPLPPPSSNVGVINGDGSIHMVSASSNEENTTGGVLASYKCNECGKIISSMANLELHANKTGHSDFAESTETITPLTDEEKKANLENMKLLIKSRKAAREEDEKKIKNADEKSRRLIGQEVAKTKEDMKADERKRVIAAQKKAKKDEERERGRIVAEIAKDKAERKANKGVLKSKLGVDGYNPDAIQYGTAMAKSEGKSGEDGDSGGCGGGGSESKGEAKNEKSEAKKQKIESKDNNDDNNTDAYIANSADAKKALEKNIGKIMQYRAGNDGASCLKVLIAYIGNALDEAKGGGDDPKYLTVNMENKAYLGRVKPFIGARKALEVLGFVKDGDANLVLASGRRKENLGNLKVGLEISKEGLKTYEEMNPL